VSTVTLVVRRHNKTTTHMTQHESRHRASDAQRSQESERGERPHTYCDTAPRHHAGATRVSRRAGGPQRGAPIRIFPRDPRTPADARQWGLTWCHGTHSCIRGRGPRQSAVRQRAGCRAAQRRASPRLRGGGADGLSIYCWPSSEVQSVRLSRRSCMMRVESL